MILQIFLTFFVIGFVSFGGGYAILPMIEMEVTNKGWMTTQEFSDVIAVAGMSPGPIATNSAIFVGFKVANLPGAFAAALGMVLPSFLLILIIGYFFYRFHHHRFMQSALYGIRPIVTALIIYAAIRFAIANDVIGQISVHQISLFAIFLLSLLALTRLRIHPVKVLLMAGLAGAILF